MSIYNINIFLKLGINYMRKLVFFLLLLFALYQKQSKAAEEQIFSDDSKIIAFDCNELQTDASYNQEDKLNLAIKQNYQQENNNNYNHKNIYKGSALESVLFTGILNEETKEQNFSFNNESLPFYVILQIELGKLILKGSSHFLKAGNFLEEIGKKIPIPYLKDVFLFSAEILKLAYNPIEETPYVYLLKTQGEKDSPIRLGYLNGMMNIDESESLYSGDLILQNTEENLKLDLFYLPSHGFVIDLLECIFLKLGLKTPNTIRFKEELRKVLAQLPEDSKYILLLHSKASLISNVALTELTEQEKDKLELYSFAPVKILSDKLSSKVRNIYSKFDGVFFQDPAGFLNYLFSDAKKINLEWLSPIEKIPFFDHRFGSATYQAKIKKIIEEVLAYYKLNSMAIP